MKLIQKILLIGFITLATLNKAWAFDLEKAINVVDSIASDSSNPASKVINKNIKDPLEKLEKKAIDKVDGVMNKVEGKIDKVTARIEGKIEKYEKKLDKYEQKFDKLEKTTDGLIDSFNKLDINNLEKMLQTAKYIAIAAAIFFILLIILLVLVFIQLTRVNKKLAAKK